MLCTHPITIKNPAMTGRGLLPHEKASMQVPCGKCLACRVNKREDWKVRLMMELESNPSQDSFFLTLTYDDEHLPDDLSVHKEDLQNFFKRLRVNYERDTGKKNIIRYFACGEYGDRFNRPHYHAIIFGFNPLKYRKILHDSWDKGFLKIGSVTPSSIGYVTGYIMKKLVGKLGEEMYTAKHLNPPFQLFSKGLGFDFMSKHRRELVERCTFEYHGRKYRLPNVFYKRYMNFADRIRAWDDMITHPEKYKFYYDRQDADLVFEEKKQYTKYNMFKQPSERESPSSGKFNSFDDD